MDSDLAADIEVIVRELAPDLETFLLQELQAIHDEGGPATRLAMNVLTREVPAIAPNVTRKLIRSFAELHGQLNAENVLMFLASILRRRNALVQNAPDRRWDADDSA